MTNSILSELPDGCGFYYGFSGDDHRRIDVRKEGDIWNVYVAGALVLCSTSKMLAEIDAIQWLKDNPE